MSELTSLLKGFKSYHVDSVPYEPNVSVIFVASCCAGDDLKSECTAIFAGTTSDLKNTIALNLPTWQGNCSDKQHIRISIKRTDLLSEDEQKDILEDLQRVCIHDTL